MMHWQLTATEATRRIRDGVISSEDLVTACLERIAETDEGIKAWVHLDREAALDQARVMDRLRQTGKPMGPLHGIPVGIKDIFDTVDMPTERGSRIYQGRRPVADAAVIERLKEAGAVILGKTCTTEVAFLHPTVTHNPHNFRHTPGGSSSGSAAAVAAGHVPLAVGSQTNGSTIRPASFCGIYGFKPTRGMISRRGCLQTSASLDQVGVFARTLQDAALLADVLAGYDHGDPGSYLRPRPAMQQGADAEPPVEPDIAWIELPFADRLDAASAEGFEELLSALGAHVERLPAPKSFAAAVDAHKIVHEYEIWHHLKDDFEAGWDKVSDTLKPVLENARTLTQAQYEDALAMLKGAEDYFVQFFHDYDAILAPSSAGEAPLISSGTGDPVFCTIWTFAGLPALSLPLLTGAAGLPIGVQLIGSSEGDDRLLRSANWLQHHLENSSDEESAT